MGKYREWTGKLKGRLMAALGWGYSWRPWRRMVYRWRERQVRKLAKKPPPRREIIEPSPHFVHGQHCWSLEREVEFCQGWMQAYVCRVRYGAVPMLPDELRTHLKIQEAIFDKKALELIVPPGWDLPGNLNRRG